MYVAVGLIGLTLICCIAAISTGTTSSKIEPTVTNTVEQPTMTVVQETPTKGILRAIAPTNAAEPTVTPTVVVEPTNTPAPIIQPVQPSGDIICKDGYHWPSKVRRGACHGHGGIRN